MLLNNQVIEWSGTRYRVLSIYRDKASLFPMNSKGTALVVVNVDALRSAELNNEIKDSPDEYESMRLKQPEGLSLKKATDNYSIIEPLVTRPELLFDAGAMKKAVAELCGHDGPSRARERRIKRLLHVWWLKGQSEGALNPGYGSSTGRRNGGAKPGRKIPIASGRGDGTAITPEIRERFDHFCRSMVLKANGDPLREAYRKFLDEFLEQHPDVSKEDAPTINQLRYFYRTEYSIRDKTLNKNSAIHFNKDVRALAGSSQDIVIGAGSIWTIDSTPSDITLVSDVDPDKIVGRPTLYIVRDVFSSMIVGLTASFDPAMYKSAADALYIAMIDKVDYCRRFGVDITEDEWPSKGIPACVVADNAELSGPQVDAFARANGVKITTDVPFRPDQKGIVEETFAALQSQVKSMLPGVPDKPGPKKSGTRDTRTEAALNLTQYTKLLLLGVKEVNLHICRSLPLGLPAEIAPSAVNLWKWSRQRNLSQLRHVGDERALRLSLLPRFEYTMSRNGVCVNHIRYFCREGAEKGYFDRGIRDKRPTDMQVAIDPADVSRAWLFPEPEKEPTKCWECTLATQSRHLAGMTLYEAGLYMDTSADAIAKAQLEADVVAAKIRKEQERIVREALEGRSAVTTPKTQRIKQISHNRRVERIVQEAASPRMPSGDAGQSPGAQAQDRGAGGAGAGATVPNYSYPQSFEDIPD